MLVFHTVLFPCIGCIPSQLSVEKSDPVWERNKSCPKDYCISWERNLQTRILKPAVCYYDLKWNCLLSGHLYKVSICCYPRSSHFEINLYKTSTCLLQAHFVCPLTLSQTINFRFFQTERVCRQQLWIWWKWQKVLQMGRKHFRKSRNFSFSHSVFIRLLLQTHKNQGLFAKVFSLLS